MNGLTRLIGHIHRSQLTLQRYNAPTPVPQFVRHLEKAFFSQKPYEQSGATKGDLPILQFLQITDPPEATVEGREKFDRYINIYIYISIYLCIYISITQTVPAQLIGGNCHL